MTKREKRRIMTLCIQKMEEWRARHPYEAAQCIGWSFAFDRPIFAEKKTA